MRDDGVHRHRHEASPRARPPRRSPPGSASASAGVTARSSTARRRFRSEHHRAHHHLVGQQQRRRPDVGAYDEPGPLQLGAQVPAGERVRHPPPRGLVDAALHVRVPGPATAVPQSVSRMAARPPGASTRATSAAAPAGRRRCCHTRSHRSTSTEPSSNGSVEGVPVDELGAGAGRAPLGLLTQARVRLDAHGPALGPTTIGQRLDLLAGPAPHVDGRLARLGRRARRAPRPAVVVPRVAPPARPARRPATASSASGIGGLVVGAEGRGRHATASGSSSIPACVDPWPRPEDPKVLRVVT